ncbi:MAG: hypothetical protein Q4E05_06780, partial [Pseudoclavibacter sp.]|nr:hypothetical protein [Pseudoclavibacter sp.]
QYGAQAGQYGQVPYGQSGLAEASASPGLGLAALVLGGLGLLLLLLPGWAYILSLLLGIAAIVLGAMTMRKTGRAKTFGLVGLGLGVLDALIGLVTVVVVLLMG